MIASPTQTIKATNLRNAIKIAFKETDFGFIYFMGLAVATNYNTRKISRYPQSKKCQNTCN
jgi:hypothetical protein